MAQRMRIAYDAEGFLFFVNITTGGYGLRFKNLAVSELYTLGLLNSRLLNYCVKMMTNRFRGGYFAINKQALERLPFCLPDLGDPREKARHDKMVSLVQRMLDLDKRLQTAKTDHDRTILERHIAATDEEIDHLVYELYELTDEEIAIVEGDNQ